MGKEFPVGDVDCAAKKRKETGAGIHPWCEMCGQGGAGQNSLLLWKQSLVSEPLGNVSLLTPAPIHPSSICSISQQLSSSARSLHLGFLGVFWMNWRSGRGLVFAESSGWSLRTLCCLWPWLNFGSGCSLWLFPAP